MKRGSVVRINLSDALPPEMGKTRPGIVISNSEQNKILSTLVVIPLSTRPPEIWPLRMKLPSIRGLRESFAVVPGIRQVSKTRILEELGLVPERFMVDLDDAISAYLNDE